MDSADLVRQTLSHRGALLGSHEQLLKGLAESNQSLSAHVITLSQQVAHLASSVHEVAAFRDEPMPTQAATKPKDTHVSDPEPFYGDLDKCRG